MKRWKSAIGLVFCVAVTQQANTPGALYYSALWQDLGLIGTVVFFIVLCIGPRKNGQGKSGRSR
ncbi:hypothetical protein AB4212_14090 [Streptomyces sp. 2MCAF27]